MAKKASSESSNRADRAILRLKNNKVFSTLIVAGIIIIAVAKVATSIKEIRSIMPDKPAYQPNSKDTVLDIENKGIFNNGKPMDEIFNSKAVYIRLDFIKSDSMNESEWQYSFFRGRIRFQALYTNLAGRFINGCVFKDGKPMFRPRLLNPNKFGTGIDKTGAIFGWIENEFAWSINTTDFVPYYYIPGKGNHLFEAYPGNDFIIENMPMSFSVIKCVKEYAIVKIEKKYR